MFPKDQRVRKTREFSKIYKFGKQANSPSLRLLFLVSNQDGPRFGFVVSKKSTKVGGAAGKIVQRNRVKRVLRDEMRKLRNMIPKNMSIVVQARDGAAKLASKALREELRQVMKKNGIIKT